MSILLYSKHLDFCSTCLNGSIGSISINCDCIFVKISIIKCHLYNENFLAIKMSIILGRVLKRNVDGYIDIDKVNFKKIGSKLICYNDFLNQWYKNWSGNLC